MFSGLKRLIFKRTSFRQCRSRDHLPNDQGGRVDVDLLKGKTGKFGGALQHLWAHVAAGADLYEDGLLN